VALEQVRRRARVEPGATAALLDLFPPDYHWRNQFTPRVMLRLPRYRPFHTAHRIDCPWLVLVCDDDAITPADQAAALASRAPRMELRRFPVGHFEVYPGGVVRARGRCTDRVPASTPAPR